MTERPISLRLDRESARALRRLMRTRGLTRSAAIKMALIESASRRSLADEAALLAADDADRAEMAEVRTLMDELRAAG